MPASNPITAPFGSWRSPVTAGLIAGATIRLGQLALQGDAIFWSEGRPKEQGRNVLVQRGADGALRDAVPAPFNVRTRAHEYGGGAFVPLPDGGAVFSHYDDQQLYRVDVAGAMRQLTTEPHQRYADAVLDAARHRLIAVREDHRAGAIDAVATVVSIPLDGGVAEVLAHGHDFFSSPVLSPDGRQLAWLSWDHPDMPWDATELWLAEVAADGALGPARCIAGGRAGGGRDAARRAGGELEGDGLASNEPAGGEADGIGPNGDQPNGNVPAGDVPNAGAVDRTGESIFQPAWSPRGELHFVSDRSGWWNLYRWRDGTAQPLHPMAAEFGQPQWAFGMSSYGFDTAADGGGRIVCSFGQHGVSALATLDPDTGHFAPLATPFCTIDGLRVGSGFAVFIGASPAQPPAVVRLDLRSGTHEVLRASSSAGVDPAFVARAEAITYPTEHGLEAHAFFYAPVNGDHRGPPGERPPLIVVTHGGPTGATDAAFKWSLQYWTSRGFAVVDVNYGGSHGYGRAYRERLNGHWGVVDVDDAVNAARFLVGRGDVNPERIAIRGGSAGGYTTLCALTFRRFFKAGASHYGIGDLEALVTDTHKFESRYLDRLIGPYPEASALYRERSPIHHTERLASPMILLQGAEDKAVPPAQAQTMFDAVAAKGLPVAYLLFEGEQHGFRRAATIQRALEAELYFYGKVFGFTPADAIEPVAIRNLVEQPLAP